MEPEIESHPWEPYIPESSKVLIMGTFPPQPKRWSMDFYYPNRTNDFWYMIGLLFYGDRNALLGADGKSFDLERIKQTLDAHGIALNDTGRKIRRLKGNASDKFLEILEPAPLDELLARMPECRAIATTGEKAAAVVAEITGTEAPRMGEYVELPNGIKHWRMPSTSRAYPLPLAQKGEYYARLFKDCGIL